MEFKKKLGVAYYTQGFFNIGIEYSDYFGEHGTIINVELSDNKHVIVGKINRTANNNGTPRIMMGTQYNKRVQQVFKQWEFMTIKIINPKLRIFIKKGKEKETCKPPYWSFFQWHFYTYISNWKSLKKYFKQKNNY